MPSAGMRKSPNVRGALRSGRRLLTKSQDKPKNVRGGDGDNKLIEVRDDTEDGGMNFNDQLEAAKLGSVDYPVLDLMRERNEESSSPKGLLGEKNNRWGIVYRRKRKWTNSTTVCSDDKRYGIKFRRRRWRKKNEPNEQLVGPDIQFNHTKQNRALFVVNKFSCDGGFWLASILASVLSYMARVRVQIQSLSAILLSEPMFGAFASHGILFRQDSIIDFHGHGIIWESESLIPLFSLDFPTIPGGFLLLHLKMSLRCASSACVLNYPYLIIDKEDGIVTNDSNELALQLFSGSDYSDIISFPSQISTGTILSGSLAMDSSDVENNDFAPPLVGPNRYSLRSVKFRNSRDSQKRRTSLKRKRGRPPSAIRARKPSGALASEFLKIRQTGGQLSATPTRVLRSSNKKSSASRTKEQNSSSAIAMRDISSTCCLANLLIIEPDKCHREEGATVSLELSDSRQWVLVITKNGEKYYNLTADRTMRPPGSNRVTHATIWTVDSSWKLEFNNKQDWLIFKELYKNCFDRNFQEPDSNDIPIPGVREVPISMSTYYVPFVRPDTYITVQHDEPTRALMRSAVYDMDSNDEDWLEKFNHGRHESITPERFELVIDALEKNYHCNPNEQATDDSFEHLENKEVIDAIRDHWIKKRKQNHSALVRIFQLYQSRRGQVIAKPAIRKKRTFKRQPSHTGRGKQLGLLQAMAAEQKKLLERRDSEEKQWRAKADAERSEKSAILKRQRAQKLMENADLATYKALMALQIAESKISRINNLSAELR